MKFGIDVPKKLTGADVYVRVLQITSLLPIAYLLTIPSYMGIITTNNVLTVLFDGGISCLPRAEALLLSLLYRITSSEFTVIFILLGFALAFGLMMKKLLHGKTARTTRYVLIVCIILDLILRLLPLSFNGVFALPYAVAGITVRLICLVLVIFDIIADKKQAKA